ncbi:MAG: diguanylate cyclase [Gemmatimonadetes bacterium]|nr:diguanylate cyclase [Gemmatimonadota bacterium]
MSLGDELLKRALTDGETGLYNRISLRLELERAVDKAERYGFPLGIVTIRCDGCSTDSLTEFARHLAGGVRRSDCLARTGDRELSLLITHEDAENATEVVERLDRLCRGYQGAPIHTEIQTDLETQDFRRLLDRV